MNEEQKKAFVTELAQRIQAPAAGPKYRLVVLVCLEEPCTCGRPGCQLTQFSAPLLATNMPHTLLCDALATSMASQILLAEPTPRKPLEEYDA